MANDSNNGYPNPGPQCIPVEDIMNNLYFMKEKQWNECRYKGDFDYVVIGSSFCGLSFTKRVLEKQPEAKILIIDRGVYFHPEHYQNLPPEYSRTEGGQSETFHWKITKDTHNGEYIKYLHGMNNFFGGRSSFWSGWCPEPTTDEMAEWPAEVIEKVHKYFPEAKKLLNVTPANEISSGNDAMFGNLQGIVYAKLQNAVSEIDGLTRVTHAPLAVRADMYRNEGYRKYAVSGPLLNLILIAQKKVEGTTQTPALQVVLNCTVKKVLETDGVATKLETSRGDFTLGKAKLVLAMGTLPPTTLMLNSFPARPHTSLAKIGTRFTAHFFSSIIARVPLGVPVVDSSTRSLYNVYNQAKMIGKLQMAAVYVAGKHPESQHQYHIQITAVIDDTPIANIYDTKRHLVAAPSLRQLETSKGYVLFVCAGLGQIDHKNPKNYYVRNDGEDITCNATLQCVTKKTDEDLWDEMDKTTFECLENYLTPAGLTIQYWSNDKNDWDQTGTRPSPSEIRVPGLVHAASTMWIGDDETAPVDLDYRFRGVENVYLTGGALWPTGASWNPTCVMCGLAMDLADKLTGHAED